MKPHAEVEQIWPRDGHIRVVGHVHGCSVEAVAAWRFLLVPRGRADMVLGYEIKLDDRRFDVTIPVDHLILPDGGSWDAYLETTALETAATPRLRVGRRLDDIREKKDVMVFPGQRTADDLGVVEVRPRYTIYENLSIDCRRVEPDRTGGR